MKYAKFIVAAIAAGLIALQTALTDGHVSSQEWITIALAVLGAVGVGLVPNTSARSAPPAEDYHRPQPGRM